MDSVDIEKIYPGEPDPHGLTKNWTPKADDPCVNIYEQTLLERVTDGFGDWKKEIKADFEQQLRRKACQGHTNVRRDENGPAS